MNSKYEEAIKIIHKYYPNFGYKKCAVLTGLNKKIITELARRNKIKKLPTNRVGEAFGRLVIISQTNDKHKNKKWLCRCECGNIKNVFYSNLQNGDIKSCGCLHSEIAHKTIFKDIRNQKFGKLLVIKSIKKNSRQSWLWECLCDCGNIKIIDGSSLRKGGTKSCGCLRKETPKGINSPLYNHNISDTTRKRQRYSDEDKKWKMTILKRDNYTCFISKLQGGSLEIHHLQNVSTNPELQFNLNNGEVLRKDIHKLFHRIFGIKNNTREQFKEFCEYYRGILGCSLPN